MNYIETFKYPIQYFNQQYLNSIPSPYNEYKISVDTTTIIDSIIGEGKIKSIFGHVSDPLLLVQDSNQYIFDLAPYILKNYTKNPEILYAAILSPTFSVSIFDTKAINVGNNEEWSKSMIQIQKMIEIAIEGNTHVPNIDILNLYTHYNTYIDRDITSFFYNPIKHFLAVALMDVYHIVHSCVYHDVAKFNFRPQYLMYEGNSDYLTCYSGLFHIFPIHLNAGYGVISNETYEDIKKKMKDFKRINNFLTSRNLTDILEKRIDSMRGYNEFFYNLIIEYIYKFCKIIQTSLLIQNKEDCLMSILTFSNDLKKKNATEKFIHLVQSLDSLIASNLVDISGPFLYKHGDLYSPIPHIIDGRIR